jgi:hypothetical protein
MKEKMKREREGRGVRFSIYNIIMDLFKESLGTLRDGMVVEGILLVFHHTGSC